jgi:hypothetical protein
MLVCLGARADQCWPVRATIATTYSLGPSCASPVGVCTAGTVLSPSFTGPSYFTAMTISPGPTADVLLYTGELVISTSAGTITIRDHGFLNTVSAQYLELQQIVSGDGAYAGAHGMLTSRGVSTATGYHGTLNGALCGPWIPAPQSAARPFVPRGALAP